MSVKFILGPSSETRSIHIYKEAIELSADPKNKIFIITPEQFTLETQKGIIENHPRHGILNIDVVSFNRLAYKVLGKVGGRNTPIIRETGKGMIIRKVLKQMEGRLDFFVGRSRRKGFVSEMKSIVSEMEQYDIEPEKISELAEDFYKLRDSRIGAKLKDIALIYAAYKEEMKARFITQEELLDVLNRRLLETDILKGCHVYFDGFTGLTPVQYKLAETIISQSESAVFSIIYDREKTRSGEVAPDSGNLFFMSDDMMNRLIDIAGKNGSDTSKCFIGYAEDNTSKDLAHLKNNIFRPVQTEFNDKVESIFITESADAREELSVIMNKIYHLTREKGYRYRDIAIVTEDLASYGEMAVKIMEQNNYPVFLDRRRPVSDTAYIENIRSIMQIIVYGYSYENMFRYIKTGFAGIENDYINEVENYCLALGINSRSDWEKAWERLSKKDRRIRRTSSLTEEPKPSYYDFKKLNAARETIFENIARIEEGLRKADSVTEMTDTVRRQIIDRAKEAGLETDEQLIEKVDALLDEIESLFGQESISPEELADILDAGFEEISVAFIPPSVDCITIGDVERTRLTDIKALFIVGANDGLIPCQNTDTGILTQADRSKISSENIFLSPGVKERAYIQRFYLYLLFNKPFESLHISYARKDINGRALKPSYILKNICDIFPQLKISGVDDREKESFAIWLPDYGRYRWDGSGNNVLQKKTLDIIFSKGVSGSVSSFEKYAGCPYSYFMQYGLGLEKREVYEFNPADFGSLVHDVLKSALEEATLNDTDLSRLAIGDIERLVDRYLDDDLSQYTILADGHRQKFVKNRIRDLSSRTLKTIGDQLAAGGFKPVFLEHDFNINKNIILSDGRESTLNFRGKIDRIDEARTEDKLYIRVIDYKTGAKSFDLNKLYNGRQIQLLAYMMAAMGLEEKAKQGLELIPSGIFYYNIQNPLVMEKEKPLSDEEIENAIQSELRLTGLVNGDPENLVLIDKEGTGMVAKGVGGRTSKSDIYPRDDIEMLEKYVDKKLENIASEILNGNMEIDPVVDLKNDVDTACAFCDFRSVCNFSPDIEGTKCRKNIRYKSDDLMEKIRNEVKGDNGNEQ